MYIGIRLPTIGNESSYMSYKYVCGVGENARALIEFVDFVSTSPVTVLLMCILRFCRVLNLIQYIISIFGIFQQRLTNIFNYTKYITYTYINKIEMTTAIYI